MIIDNIFSLSVAGALYIALQTLITVHILLFKDDVKSAVGWIGLVWLSPLFGAAVYIILGVNRIKRKAFSLRHKDYDILKLTGKTVEEIQRAIPAHFEQLLRLGYKVHPQMFSLGNKLTPLINGDEAYPAMCSLIAGARHEVLLQSYIFDNDAAGQMFLTAIKSAVQNGAKVYVLIDGIGLNYSRPNILRPLKRIKGVHTAVFLPSRSPINLPFVNLRNHRKMLIVDGCAAVFGGMNIAHGNMLSTKPKSPISDVTFLVEGDAAEQMSAVFLSDWLFARGHKFTPHGFGLERVHKGKSSARIIPDGPDADRKTESLILGALCSAQKTVRIVTPYFLPENNILDALEVCAMRGVEVEIFLPHKNNIFGMDYAMQANFAMLLKKGIKIYKTNAPFDHSKIFTVDSVWSLTGSSNWDVRSFRLNFEASLECFDPSFARELDRVINLKKAHAAAVHPPKKNIFITLRNNAFRLLTPYY